MSKVNPSSKSSVDLRSQLAVVRRYWWFTAMILVASLAATFVLTQRQERIYSSSAQVVLRTSTTATRFPFSTTAPRELSRNAETEVGLANGASFKATAREQSPPGVSVEVRASGESTLVFTGRGTDPADVAEAATIWAELYVAEQYAALVTRIGDDMEFLEATLLRLSTERDEVRSEVAELEILLEATSDPEQFARLLSQKVSIEALLQPQLGPKDQQIASFARDLSELQRITLFLDEPLASARLGNAASGPAAPVSPNVLRNMLTGAFLGLALGMGIPFVWHALSDNIGDTNDVLEISQTVHPGCCSRIRERRRLCDRGARTANKFCFVPIPECSHSHRVCGDRQTQSHQFYSRAPYPAKAKPRPPSTLPRWRQKVRTYC